MPINKTVELQFALEVEDDWPPVSVEGLPFEETPSGFVATVPPLFVKDLSVGDVIAAEKQDDGTVASWHHVSRSSNSVVWLLRVGPNPNVGDALTELEKMGCRTASLPSLGCYSVSVPSELMIESVDSVVQQLDPEQVAVAYPSFRHPEG